MSQYCAVLNIL